MTTFRKWLDAFAIRHGEPTAFLTSDESSWGDYGMEAWPTMPTHVVPSLSDEFLDHEFSDGYGSPGCPALYAWSDGFVFIVTTYDGSTSWSAVPRHPGEHTPQMFGGG
jgi:hypothetical protein